MRTNRIAFSLACLLASAPCLAGAVPGNDTDGSPATVGPTLVPANGIADGDVSPDRVLSSEELQPSASVAASNEAGNTGIGIPVDAGELDQLRGGESTVANDVLIDGTVEGNTADRIVSGANAISDGAFTNANGINTVIQNTGSNVLIQNGMVVNVQFVAPTP